MIDSYMSNEIKPFDLFLISPRRLLQQHWHKRWLSSRSKFLIFSTCIPQSFLVDYHRGQSNLTIHQKASFTPNPEDLRQRKSKLLYSSFASFGSFDEHRENKPIVCLGSKEFRCYCCNNCKKVSQLVSIQIL